MRSILIIFIICMPILAQAQDWATYDVCVVHAPKVHQDSIAPETIDTLNEKAGAISNSRGKYWKITTAEGRVSYLWGTMHSNDRLILDLPDVVEQQIRQSRVMAMESDYVFQSRPAYLKFAIGGDRFMPPDTMAEFTSLDIPGNVKGWIRSRMEGIGWGKYAPDYLRPAALAEILLYDPCNDFAAGTYPIQDSRIQMLGAIEGAAIVGLEPANAFSNKLNDHRNSELTTAIIATYGAYLNPNRSAGDTATYYSLYLAGRIGALMVLDKNYMENIYGVGKGRALLKLTDDYLLRERNQNFLKRALPELHQGGVFMAIGHFHLPGQTGMITLLRNAGFTVERVMLPNEARP